jgi:hypothetical protein
MSPKVIVGPDGVLILRPRVDLHQRPMRVKGAA